MDTVLYPFSLSDSLSKGLSVPSIELAQYRDEAEALVREAHLGSPMVEMVRNALNKNELDSALKRVLMSNIPHGETRQQIAALRQKVELHCPH